MIDSETMRFIRLEVERQMNVLLTGQAQNATESKETISNLFPGMDDIPDFPVSHPWGLSSAAPDGTPVLSGKRGAHFGNRIILGHMDPKRPKCPAGDTVLFDAYGRLIELRKGRMTLTNPDGAFDIKNTGTMAVTSNEKELLEILIRLLTTIINARTNTVFGPQPLIPDVAGAPQGATWVQIKADLKTMQGGS